MVRKLTRGLASLATGLALSGAALSAPVGYVFDITTFYQFGTPADLTFADFGVASPDTGYWRVTNSGSTTFVGSIGQVAASNFGGDFSYSHAVTLAPGTSVTFAVNFESSNMGGYNGPFGSPQPGVEIFLTGLLDGVEAVDLHVFDRDIHSGLPATNPLGETLDNYVLQGGTASGGDTGDAFEVAQAPGRFRFAERIGVPEPSSIALLGAALLGLGLRRRRS